MKQKHQYSIGVQDYSGATELIHKPSWNSTSIKENTNFAPIIVIRRGSLVTISGFMSLDATIAGNGSLTTLPPEFRPTRTAALIGKSNRGTSGNVDTVFYVTPVGNFYNNTDSIEGYFFINQTYHVLDSE